MRLNELCEDLGNVFDFIPQVNKVKTVASSKRAANRSTTTDRQLGVGAFGSAYKSGLDVGRVTKVARGVTPSKKQENRDGYVEWIKRTHNTHNPYFPQVMYFKSVVGEDRMLGYRIQLERLYPIESASEEETLAMKERMFGDTDEIPTGISFVTAIPAMLDRMATTKDMSGVVDPALRQAIEVLSGMVDDGFVLDLHAGNVMLRRTKFGPQLVITDPSISRQ